MFLSEWPAFHSVPCLPEIKKYLKTARVSMLLKSRASLTCFRACFLPGRDKDLSAPQHSIPVTISDIRLFTFELVKSIPALAWGLGSGNSVPFQILEEPTWLWFSGVPRGCLGVSNPPSRNSECPPKSCQTQQDCENC